MAELPRNPKLRNAGLVLVVLAVLCFVGTATGLDAHGSTGRIVFAVVGVVLLLLGVMLLRSRTPAVASIRADGAGLHVQVSGGAPAVVPWPDVEAVWLRRIGVVFGQGGHLLGLTYTDSAGRHAALRPFEHLDAQRHREVLIGLTNAQSTTLLQELPAAAGQRYSLRG